MAVKSINISKAKAFMRKAASTNHNRIHIIPFHDKWLIKKEGLKRSSGEFATKDEAKVFAMNLRKSGAIIVIHRMDGSVESSLN